MRILKVVMVVQTRPALILGNSRCNLDCEILKIIQCQKKRDCALEDVQIDLKYVNSSNSYHKVYICWIQCIIWVQIGMDRKSVDWVESFGQH